MQLENYVFEIVDKILNCIAGMIGLLLLLYACYTWWDTQQIYENASATSYSVYNPKNQESFEELVKINPKKQHGNGNDFHNMMESVIENSSSQGEAAVVCMALSMIQ